MYLPGYPITSPYGNRPQFSDFHDGVDYGTPTGTPLEALVDGVIQFSGLIPPAKPGYSQELLVILQAKDFFIVYGHLSESLVKKGQRVVQGEVICRSGNSGYTTAPHLHIEQRLGIKIDAKPLRVYQSVDITPLLKSYKEEPDVTEEEFDAAKDEWKWEGCRNTIRLLGDIIEANPHYEETKKEAFKALVDRLYYATEPLEDRRVGHEFMANAGVLNMPDMDEFRKSCSSNEAQKKLDEVKKIVC